MIDLIWLDNFKSLVDFELKPAKFTCLVGLNSTGKSTVLQAMDFLSQLMSGDLDGWLKQRQWDRADINSKLTKKLNIDFKVVVNHPKFGAITWSGSISRRTLSCTQERVEAGHLEFLRVDDGNCTLLRELNNQGDIPDHEKAFFSERFPIRFEYQGSILSQLKDKQIIPVLRVLKNAVTRIKSLDLLSPELLRKRTKASDGKLGLGGEKLSAYIHEAGKEGKEKLKQSLTNAYSQLEKIDTRSLRSGWKQLEITERFGEHVLKTPARHMNDGMLRLMAILAQLEGDDDFLLFDEIENGVNPELIEFLIDRLVETPHQVLVTTHSPMILNFMEDDVARQGVVYLYKNDKGITQSIPLFSIPSMAKKLEFMGPGEAFVDTDLMRLYQEIENMST